MNNLNITTIAETVNTIDSANGAKAWIESVNLDWNADEQFGTGVIRTGKPFAFTTVVLDLNAETIKTDVSEPVQIDDGAAWELRKVLSK